MRYWFDTEFIEDGKTIDLISIGIVAEDGREFYVENLDCDFNRACPWVKEHVFPHLQKDYHPNVHMSRDKIKLEILEFVGNDIPEFWGYFAAYDWVVLCQIFGRMIDLPKNWPMFCRDIVQFQQFIGCPRLPVHTGTLHNALDDARWTRDSYLFLEKESRRK